MQIKDMNYVKNSISYNNQLTTQDSVVGSPDANFTLCHVQQKACETI